MRHHFGLYLKGNSEFHAVGISCGRNFMRFYFLMRIILMRSESHAEIKFSIKMRNLMRTEFDTVLYLIFSVKSITIA